MSLDSGKKGGRKKGSARQPAIMSSNSAVMRLVVVHEIVGERRGSRRALGSASSESLRSQLAHQRVDGPISRRCRLHARERGPLRVAIGQPGGEERGSGSWRKLSRNEKGAEARCASAPSLSKSVGRLERHDDRDDDAEAEGASDLLLLDGAVHADAGAQLRDASRCRSSSSCPNSPLKVAFDNEGRACAPRLAKSFPVGCPAGRRSSLPRIRSRGISGFMSHG